MGVLWNGICHPNTASARAQLCSEIYTIDLQGTNFYTLECNSSAVNLQMCKRTNGGACTLISSGAPAFQNCDEYAPFPSSLGLDQGALIAGAVLAVWAVGYGFRALIRTLSIDSKTSTSESET